MPIEVHIIQDLDANQVSDPNQEYGMVRSRSPETLASEIQVTHKKAAERSGKIIASHVFEGSLFLVEEYPSAYAPDIAEQGRQQREMCSVDITEFERQRQKLERQRQSS